MKVRIARSRREARSWTGRAVAVDVLRASTTLCALLARGRRRVRVCANPAEAVPAARRWKAELFSELELGVPHTDNSPHLALAARCRRAILVTGAGTPAMLSLRRAELVWSGCFANLPALAAAMRRAGGDWLIVPASLFGLRQQAEDRYCARAIRDQVAGRDNPASWVRRLRAGARPREQLAFRPSTGRRDLDLALTVGAFPFVPRIRVRQGWGEALREPPAP
jgi:phosphosulfolactate phosphohydrolase-like enzyme